MAGVGMPAAGETEGNLGGRALNTNGRHAEAACTAARRDSGGSEGRLKWMLLKFKERPKRMLT